MPYSEREDSNPERPSRDRFRRFRQKLSSRLFGPPETLPPWSVDTLEFKMLDANYDLNFDIHYEKYDTHHFINGAQFIPRSQGDVSVIAIPSPRRRKVACRYYVAQCMPPSEEGYEFLEWLDYVRIDEAQGSTGRIRDFKLAQEDDAAGKIFRGQTLVPAGTETFMLTFGTFESVIEGIEPSDLSSMRENANRIKKMQSRLRPVLYRLGRGEP